MKEHYMFYKIKTWVRGGLIAIFLAASSPFLPAQFYDDFSGDLTPWSGQTERFIINQDGELQLEAHGYDHASIYRKLDSLPQKIWGGTVILDFSPSGQNKLDIVLIEHTMPAYQIRLEIGQTGSPDPLSLIYESNDTLISMATGVTFTQSVEFKYRIEAGENQWRLHIQTPETIVNDSIMLPSLPLNSGTFKLNCHFTPSRSDLFYFDNLYAGALEVDTIPPYLDTLWIIDSTSINLTFNEPLGKRPLDRNLSVQGHQGGLQSSLSYDSLSLLIELDEPLDSGSDYTARILDVEDLAGNSGSIFSEFTYYDIRLARPYDLLITEIMADPSPALGLPECEYVEIYNRSNQFLRMSDYTLADDSRQVFLPNKILAPGQYAVVMDQDCCEYYDTNVTMWCLQQVPAFNNDADVVEVLDYIGRSIHRVPYDRSWYEDGQEDGGWSLEMIDLDQPCLGQQNWTSARFEAFGSPGKPNSVKGNSSQKSQPRIIAAVLDTSSITLSLNHTLHPDHLPDITIRPPLKISDIQLDGPSTLKVRLDRQPEKGRGYMIDLTRVLNCIGEKFSTALSTTLFLPRRLSHGDLIINEVLYNPFRGSNDFVEIINASEDHVKVDRLCVECQHATDTSISCLQVPFIIAPGQVIAWSEDTNSLKHHYPTGYLIQNELVGLPDDGGHLFLHGKIGSKLVAMDSMQFHDDLHSPVLTSSEGYALERLRASTPRQEGQWISATTASGGATPGLRNSQAYPEPSLTKEVMSIPFSSFSPNGDGQRDFLPIDIQLPDKGYIGRIDIFEKNGRYLGGILKEGLIGTNFSMAWSGRLEGATLLPGFYILRGLFVHPDGKRLVSKVSCFLIE